MHIKERAAAVPWFNGNRELDHLKAVQIPHGRDDSLHDAMLQTQGITHGDHRRALLERIRIAERQGRKIRRIDSDHCQVEFAVPGVDFGYIKFPSVLQLHLDGPRFADDMQTGRNESIRGNHKSSADPVLLANH